MRRNITQEKAVGSVNYEWKQMAKLALRLRTTGFANPTWIEEQKKKFTGIFKRLLTDPIEEVQRETR